MFGKKRALRQKQMEPINLPLRDPWADPRVLSIINYVVKHINELTEEVKDLKYELAELREGLSAE